MNDPRPVDGQLARILTYLPDPEERAQVVAALEETYAVASFTTEALAAAFAESVAVDAAIMPRPSAAAMAAARRRHGLPVLVVVDPDAVANERAEPDLSAADDFIVRPVSLAELRRRIAALVEARRGPVGVAREVVGPDGIVVRPAARELVVAGEAIRLRPLECSVLRVLLEHRGEVVGVDMLLDEVWGPERASRNLVEAQVSRIRSKLRDTEADGLITTVHGVGYLVR